MFVSEAELLALAGVLCRVCASWMQLGDRGQVEVDFAKAFQLFTELADVGHPAGQHVSFNTVAMRNYSTTTVLGMHW